jgi:hypothetical protein
MDIAAQLTVVEDRADRRDVVIDATIRQGRAPIDIVIIDISVTGFRATLHSDLRVGEDVIVGAPALGKMRARVAWTSAGECGFEFWQPISPEDAASARSIDTVHYVAFPAAAPSPAIDADDDVEDAVDIEPPVAATPAVSRPTATVASPIVADPIVAAPTASPVVADTPPLSPRSRVAIIVGGSALLWGLVLIAVMAI